MLDWILYIVIYLVITTIIAVIISFLASFVYKKIHKKNFWEGYRNTFDLLIRFLGILIVPFIITYFLFSIINYKIPLTGTDADFANVDRVERLNVEIEKLNKTLNRINELTLAQIQDVLSRTLILIQELKDEAINQQHIIIDLQNSVDIESKNAEDAKRHAASIESLSKEQIEAIQTTITLDSKRQNVNSFWLGAIISLPIGIIASMLAALFISTIRKRMS